MMNKPLVSVICLCHNHERFVDQAIQSVFNQTYSSIQLIVLDDGSADGSVQKIISILSNKPEIVFVANKSNCGYVKSLTQALTHVKGEFIVDLAADDMLLPTRIEDGVNELTNAGLNYGVNFSDAELINEYGNSLGLHSNRHAHSTIPQGEVYKAIIERYFICPPTMLFRKSVIDRLGGYDESLAYEDFDFFIRSSREFYFCYTPKVLVKRRVVSNSMSSKQFEKGNEQRWSTLRVCEKIDKLNRNDLEKDALKKRIRYEFLLSLRMLDFKLAIAFLKLYFRLSSPSTMLT
jgi:glycosyltransferase involved in cell wall biosynthesis